MEVTLHKERLVEGKWSNAMMLTKFWKCMTTVSFDIHEANYSGN